MHSHVLLSHPASSLDNDDDDDDDSSYPCPHFLHLLDDLRVDPTQSIYVQALVWAAEQGLTDGGGASAEGASSPVQCKASVHCVAGAVAREARLKLAEQCEAAQEATRFDVVQVGAHVGASTVANGAVLTDPIYAWLRYEADVFTSALLIEPLQDSFVQLVSNYRGSVAQLVFGRALHPDEQPTLRSQASFPVFDLGIDTLPPTQVEIANTEVGVGRAVERRVECIDQSLVDVVEYARHCWTKPFFRLAAASQPSGGVPLLSM